MFSSKSKNKRSILTKSAKLNLNKSALKHCTNIVHNNIKKQYQKTFGVNFADILVETQKGLKKKATQVQKKRGKRNQGKTEKNKSSQSFLQVTWKCSGMKMLLTGIAFRKLNYASIKTIK